MTPQQKECKHQFDIRHSFEDVLKIEGIVSVPVRCLKCNIEGYSYYKYLETRSKTGKLLNYNPT